MGLVKLAFTSINSTLHDKWDEYIRCDKLGNNDLIIKKNVKNGFNSLIRIQVLEGQLVLIYSNGNILDIANDSGIYTFNENSMPLSKDRIDKFQCEKIEMENSVYYINDSELKENKFGEMSKVLYHDIDYNDIYIRYYGTFSVKISNPIVFFNMIIDKIDTYKKENLIQEIMPEFTGALSLSVELCSKDGVSYKNLINSSAIITRYLNQTLNWGSRLGLEVTSVNLENVIFDNEVARMNNHIDSIFEEPPLINKLNKIKNCPRCGNEITGRFCSECGFKIE